ncbi:MAG: molybdate ABC transporter permease subunit [Phascolarctobacterium sp.]|nr:molybdate ABC transporter permease subunit [Phascolarctobacterium sp.]
MIDFSPIWISLKTAIVTIGIVFFLGILVAWWVVRRKNEISKIFVDGILSLPSVLPPTVTGFFLLYVFGNNRAVGQFFNQQFGVQIAFSWVATVLAAAVISFPLMYRSARGAFEQVDVELLQAGRTLGMSEWSIFRKVLLPNALPGIVSGGVLAFARGLGEFGATAMIAGNIVGKTRTLPLAVYSSVVSGEIGEAAYYVAIVVVICLVMVVGLNWYLYLCKKRQGN